MNLCFYEALDRIPLGVCVTIEFIGPVAVAVAVLAPARSTSCGSRWPSSGSSCSPTRSAPAPSTPSGLALILAAAACWAVYIVLAQRATRVFHGSTGLALAAGVAWLMPLAPGLTETSAGELLAPAALATGLAVAVLSSVIPYSLESESLRRLPASVFGVLMSLEPAVAALAGFVVLGQRLSARDLVAIALVIWRASA